MANNFNGLNNSTASNNVLNEMYSPNTYVSQPQQQDETHAVQAGMQRSPTLLNDVLREFHQHVETARMVNARGLSISNILNRQSSSVEHPSASQNNQSVTNSESTIINLENVIPVRNEPNNVILGHSNFQAASLLNNDASGANGGGNNGGSDGATTDAMRHVFEAQQSLGILQKYLPFLLILIAKAVYDNCEGIFNLIILFATFMHANSVVKREAIKQSKRNLSKLFVALLYILACFAFIAYVFEDEKLYLNLIFIPPYKQPSTVWALLWTTGLTDFILKLITIIFKIILTALPVQIILYQRRGKVYLFIEAVSQLYRSLTTIQPWLYYLLESYQGAEKIVGVFLSAAYMVSKGTDLMCRLRLFKASVLKLLQNVTLGSLPSKDQIQTAGNHCPICHDQYDTPVLLQCRHIFCESCVSTWFDREQTCPLCRAKIVDDPSWRDGSTTYFMQLF